MSHVIALAAPVGAGKTSLVKAIAERLVDASTLHYDSYERVTETPVQELVQWMRRGADFDELPVPRLAQDLARLKQGQSVVDPLTRAEVRSRKYLLFEMPLGREHKETCEYIDLLIWVETPLDLALARKLKEFTGDFPAGHERKDPRDCLLWLDRYLDHYLEFTRHMLEIQKERVSVNADIVLDGREDLETLARQATEAIRHRIP